MCMTDASSTMVANATSTSLTTNSPRVCSSQSFKLSRLDMESPLRCRGAPCASPFRGRKGAQGARGSVLDEDRVAEREGFEPPVELPPHLISSQARSTGLRHLSEGRGF